MHQPQIFYAQSMYWMSVSGFMRGLPWSARKSMVFPGVVCGKILQREGRGRRMSRLSRRGGATAWIERCGRLVTARAGRFIAGDPLTRDDGRERNDATSNRCGGACKDI